MRQYDEQGEAIISRQSIEAASQDLSAVDRVHHHRADVFDVGPADGGQEDDEEDPVEMHAEDCSDVIVAVTKKEEVTVRPQNI